MGAIPSVHTVPYFGILNRVNTLTAPFSQSIKRLASSNAEAIIKTNLADGVVIVSDCEITTAGLIMGCIKSNCPILVMPLGVSRTTHVHMLQFTGGTQSRKSKEGIERALEMLTTSAGYDSFIMSAPTFFMGLEVAGVCLNNASLGTYNSAKQLSTAFETGKKIIDVVKGNLSSRRMFSRASHYNVVAFLLSIGGSVAGIKHLLDLFTHDGTRISHSFISDYAGKVPLLLQPDAHTYKIEMMGGIKNFLK